MSERVELEMKKERRRVRLGVTEFRGVSERAER